MRIAKKDGNVLILDQYNNFIEERSLKGDLIKRQDVKKMCFSAGINSYCSSLELENFSGKIDNKDYTIKFSNVSSILFK